MALALAEQKRHETGIDLDRAIAALALGALYPQAVPARMFNRALDAQRLRDRIEVFRAIRNTLDAIGKAGATFRSLSDQWADTTTPHGRLMLTVLGGLAEFERHLILSRTAEGRTRAQANGVRFGRKPSLTAYQRAEALRRRAQGETLVEIARSFNVSHMTIARLGSE